MFVCYARQIKNIFEFWLETDFFFPHHAKQLFQNISKHELNSKQVPLWAGYPRIFQASLQTEAAAFPEIILNSLDIKYISVQKLSGLVFLLGAQICLGAGSECTPVEHSSSCKIRNSLKWQGTFLWHLCYRPVSWFRWDHSFVSGRWQCLGSLQCPEEVKESNYCSTNMLQFKNTSASNHPSAEVLTSNTVLPQNT